MTSLHASRHERLPQNLEGLVVITRLNCTIDEKPTSIDERSPAVLKYRTPHFRCVITRATATSTDYTSSSYSYHVNDLGPLHAIFF